MFCEGYLELPDKPVKRACFESQKQASGEQKETGNVANEFTALTHLLKRHHQR